MSKEAKPKTILYGGGTFALKSFNFINLEYELIGVCDKDKSEKNALEEIWQVPFIEPSEINQSSFDCILIASTYENEIRWHLINEMGIPVNKIRSAQCEYNAWIGRTYHSFGEANPNRVFYVLTLEGTVGLLAYYRWAINALRYAIEHNYTLVIDGKNYYNTYTDIHQMGKVNVWDLFFQQPFCDITLEEVYKSKYVIFTRGDYDYRNLKQPDAYGWDLQKIETRFYYHELFAKYLGLSSEVIRQSEAEFTKLFQAVSGNVLGIQIRGTDYTKRKPFLHAIQPSIEEVGDKAEEFLSKYQIDYIYIASDEMGAIHYFEKRFPNKIIYMDRLYYDEYNKSNEEYVVNHSFGRENDAYLRGLEYLVSIYLLAKCNYFISGNCNSCIVAHILQPQYLDAYVFDKGKYGRDDDAYLGAVGGAPFYLKGSKGSKWKRVIKTIYKRIKEIYNRM